MPPSDPLRDYAIEKVRHVVEKYFQLGELEAHVVMSVEKFWHIADFTISLKGSTVKVEERSEDMYSSVDLAMDKIERQVRRHKDKLRSHKALTELALSEEKRHLREGEPLEPEDTDLEI